MNFQDLYRKIQAIDEGAVEPKDELQGGAGASDESIEECGDMMPHSLGASKQSDSVTMNISMNGSGAGGIRDLMAVLRDIENGADDTHAHKEPLVGDEQIVGMEEEIANAPAPTVAGIEAVLPTGDDLASHGGNEVEKVNGGGNPYTNESLVSQLAALYEEVKGEKKEKEPEGLYSKKRFETDSQRLARLAKEKRQAEKKERMRNDFNAEMERE